MNSSWSTTCVQLASLLSRTPNCAEIDNPEAQIPLKPASRTMRADNPLCASMRNSNSALCSMCRNLLLRVCVCVLATGLNAALADDRIVLIENPLLTVAVAATLPVSHGPHQ